MLRYLVLRNSSTSTSASYRTLKYIPVQSKEICSGLLGSDDYRPFECHLLDKMLVGQGFHTRAYGSLSLGAQPSILAQMHVDAWLSPSPQCPITMSPWWDAHGVGMKRIWRTCLSHRPMSEIKILFFLFWNIPTPSPSPSPVPR